MAIVDVVSLSLGTVGSIGGILWIRDRGRRYFRSRAFWKLFNLADTDRVIVVVPTGGRCFDRKQPDPPSPPDPNIVTTVEDSMARASVYSALIKHGIAPVIRLHNAISNADRAHNLVLICGPAGNCITRDFFARPDIPHPYIFAREDEKWLIKDADDQVVASYTDEATIDYALIVKSRNPWAAPGEERHVYVVAGLEGLGTWGAAQMLSTNAHTLLRYLRAPGPFNQQTQFSAVIQVHRSGTEEPTVRDVRVRTN